MKQKAYHLVFDGLADWETPLALCAITESARYDVVTVGFSPEAVTTMGGLKLLPDITTADIDAAAAAIFIIPGGGRWEQQSDDTFEALLRQLHGANVPIAAICGATLPVVRAGLTHGRRHTSNGKWYLQNMVPGYRGDETYVEALAVTDGGLITASGLGSIEFGHEIIRLLDLFGEAETQEWFEMHKHGVVPARYQQAP
jgi:putative intracellular protease/amidase